MKMTPYKGDKPYIFVSYAHKDGEKVLPLLAHMQEDGYRVWMDEGIDPGTEWDDFIADKLYDCSYFIAFLSDNYLASSNCKDELNYARDLEKPRLLIYLEDVELPRGMAMRLNRLQSIFKNRYTNEREFFAKLYQADGIAQFYDETLVVRPEIKTKKPRAKKDRGSFVPNEELTEAFENSLAAFSEEVKEEILEVTEKLCQVMHQLNLDCDPISVSRGVSVTRYELRPRENVAVSSILRSVPDIEMKLSETGVRMQVPIPGRALIGCEVKNRRAGVVSLEELMEEETFKSANKTTFCLGRDIDSKPVFPDLARLPHLLVGGQTGSGKTTMVYSMLLSLLEKNTPEDLRLILCDPKQVEFIPFSGVPHLYHPIVTDVGKTVEVLYAMLDEMERRYRLLVEKSCRSIDDYNKKVPQEERLPRLVLVVDELSDLMLLNRSEVETLIARLVQKCRAAGIYILLMTQRVSSDVVTGILKANVPSRLSFRMPTVLDSRMMIESSGAERLGFYGDALYAPIGSIAPLRVQCAYVDYETVTKKLAVYQDAPVFDEAFLEMVKAHERPVEESSASKRRSSAKGAVDIDRGDLELVLELATTTSPFSTSVIQRKLAWGYGRAAKIIGYLLQKELVEKDPSGKKFVVRFMKEDIQKILADFDK